jgi:hypothetical protein
MKKQSLLIVSFGIVCIIASMSLFQCTNSSTAQKAVNGNVIQDPIADNAKKMLEEGKQTFRFETFGDESYWTDALQLNKAIAGEKNGGLGAGLSPKAALAAGWQKFSVPMGNLPLH